MCPGVYAVSSNPHTYIHTSSEPVDFAGTIEFPSRVGNPDKYIRGGGGKHSLGTRRKEGEQDGQACRCGSSEEQATYPPWWEHTYEMRTIGGRRKAPNEDVRQKW